jgi:acetyl esterase/lipase
MSTTLAQYQPLYNTIPNNIPSKNQENESSNAGILIIEKVSIPSYQYFRVANDNQKRPCVIICPGGGYAILAAGHEGSDLAKYFNSIGVNALVLKYRIPNAENQIDKSIAPLQDAQQALLLARTNAENWGIDKNKIGVMGFSAGGHLASSLASHYNDIKIENPSKISLRPDFQILIYPVISFGPEGHEGSRINLIGNANDAKTVKAIDYFSNEK